MKIQLNKRSVAQVAQALSIYKEKHPESMQPMRDAYNHLTNSGAWLDSQETKERFLRVARLLGWAVSKNGGNVYENGVMVWSTDGD